MFGRVVARTICLAVLGTFCCAQAFAVEPYTGSRILPKKSTLDVRSENSYPVYENDFAWPATVGKTEGQWLLILDDGRSRPDGRPSKGWVRKGDVILTSKDPIEIQYPTAMEYYTAQLAQSSSGTSRLGRGRAIWLRGVSWEDAGDRNAARDDYRCAINLPEIRECPYEDEAYAGLARCLSSLMVRDNSAIFGSAEASKL